MTGMDIRKTAEEIGLFETAINLAKVRESLTVMNRIGTAMPMPDADIASQTQPIARWLLQFGKRKYMFLTPEIALVEAMISHTGDTAEYTFAVGADMDLDAWQRLNANLPKGARVTLLKESHFPEYYPGNSMLVVCGYSAGGRTMVLSDTYRMAQQYKSFRGKKVFIPYVSMDAAVRYDDWMETNREEFSAEWRRAS